MIGILNVQNINTLLHFLLFDPIYKLFHRGLLGEGLVVKVVT